MENTQDELDRDVKRDLALYRNYGKEKLGAVLTS